MKNVISENGKATENKRIKKWSKYDIINLKAKTHNQQLMVHEFINNQHICAYGSAGTGKTLMGMYLGFSELLQENSTIEKIIIVRSTVPSRDQGFLPGTEEEKKAIYELPYKDMCAFLFGKANTYDDMKESGKIQFVSTSYVRGLTWDNSIIIVDELQNLTFQEIDSIFTRIGKNSRMILLGDIKQTDLCKKNDQSGMSNFIQIIKNIKEFSMIEFTPLDILRSNIVKKYLIIKEEMGL